MEPRSFEADWERLAELLGPIHGGALATARRLGRSRADGDDLYQEAVLRAFDKLHTLRDASRFRAWFYAVLLSRHRSRSRRPFWKRHVPMDDAFAGGREPIGEDGARWSDERRRARRANEALASLDAAQREVIVLFEIDGYTIEEIADMQRVSLSAVKSRLARGRRKLRRFYERRGWAGGGGTLERNVETPCDPDRDHDALARVVAPRLATAPGYESGKEQSHE